MKTIDTPAALPMRFLLAGAVLAATLGGCAIKRPTLKLRDIEVAGLDFKKLDLVLDLAVTNPNSHQISLYGLEYDLAAGGESFAAGALPRPVTPLAAKHTTIVKVPVALEFKRLLPLLTKATSGEAVDCELNVTATFDFIGVKLSVPLKRRGRLPALRAPSWRFRDVKWVGSGRSVVALTFEVENPNRFALPLRSLSGALMAGDKPLLRVDRSSLSPIPAGKTASVVVPVKLDVAAALAAVARAINDPKSLRFEGNLDLDPPVALHELLVQGLQEHE